MSTVAIRNPFAGIPPKPVRLKNIRGESPTATILHFERVSRLLILDLEDFGPAARCRSSPPAIPRTGEKFTLIL